MIVRDQSYVNGNYVFTFAVGGMYIDITVLGEDYAFEAINVVGSNGEMLIENAKRGYMRRCNRWIREQNKVS